MPEFSEIWPQIVTAWQQQSALEVVAVVSAILYLLLAIRENIWCWLFAFVSTGIYIHLFHSVALFSESLLNVFYLAMAVVGWYQWQRNPSGHNNQRPIQKWSLRQHLPWLLLAALTIPLLGYQMQAQGADFPYLDAATSCFAVLGTFLVVYKVFENWYYWLVIDLASIYLFWEKGLYLTAALFVLYVVLVFFGIRQWSVNYARQTV